MIVDKICWFSIVSTHIYFVSTPREPASDFVWVPPPCVVKRTCAKKMIKFFSVFKKVTWSDTRSDVDECRNRLYFSPLRYDGRQPFLKLPWWSVPVPSSRGPVWRTHRMECNPKSKQWERIGGSRGALLTFLSGQQQRLDVCNPVHAVIHFHLLKVAVDGYLMFLHAGLLKKHIRDFFFFLKRGFLTVDFQSYPNVLPQVIISSDEA